MKIFNYIKTTSLKALATLSLCSLLVCGEIGCTTSWITEVEQLEPVAVSAVTTVISIIALLNGAGVSAADINTVTGISNQINTDLNTALKLVQSYNSANATTTIQQINAALASAEALLPQILTDLHVTDAATVAKVTALVNLIQSQISAWEALIPALSGAKVSRVSVSAVLSKHEFKRQFNEILKSKTGSVALDHATAQVHKI
jgi:hypothetical protein